MSNSSSASGYHAHPIALPKGNYNAEVTNASAVLRDPEGYYRVHVDLDIKTEGHVGKKVSKEYHLTSKKAVGFLKTELGKVGITVNGVGDLDSACSKLVGKELSLSVDHQANGNIAVYVKGPAQDEKNPSKNYDAIWGD